MQQSILQETLIMADLYETINLNYVFSVAETTRLAGTMTIINKKSWLFNQGIFLVSYLRYIILEIDPILKSNY
jgi:hypothetical protein